MNMDKERAAFEAVLCDKYGYKADSIASRRVGSQYSDISLSMAWRLWQARASLPMGVPDGHASALDAAVSAIYFDDGSDFLRALWDVVRSLSPELAKELEANPSAAWHKVQNMLAAAPSAPAGEAVKPKCKVCGDFGSPCDSCGCTGEAVPVAGVETPDSIDFGFDDRSVKVSQEAYAIFLERERALRQAIQSLQDQLQDMQAQAPSLPAAGSAEWIEHGPSKACPFSSPYTSKVDVRLRDGTERLGDLACNTIWFWYEHDPKPYDVVAYRIAALSAQQSAQLVGGDSVSVPSAELEAALGRIADGLSGELAAIGQLRALLSRNGNGGGV